VPKAAEVAAATCGLARLLHIPNGAMLTMGWLSMMLATGWSALVTRFTGRTVNVDGASPKVHISPAELVTTWPMSLGRGSGRREVGGVDEEPHNGDGGVAAQRGRHGHLDVLADQPELHAFAFGQHDG